MQSPHILAAILFAALAASCGETAFNGENAKQQKDKTDSKIDDHGTKNSPNLASQNPGTPGSEGIPGGEGLVDGGGIDAPLIGDGSSESSSGIDGEGGIADAGITDGEETSLNPGTDSGADSTGGGTTGGNNGGGGGGGGVVVDEVTHRPSRAIAHCLEAWKGQHPFSTTNPKYRTININPFLGTASLVWDQRYTKEPELIYVHSDFSNPLPIAAGAYHLQNPNGWYCLDVNFDRGNNWQPNSLGSVLGLPVPSIGDVGGSSIIITCGARLTQVRHTGGDLARFVTILRMHLLPPVPCLDGKDSLLKVDWNLPFVSIQGSVL